jgi:N-dimethylarginine dimethylaminohydrolase
MTIEEHLTKLERKNRMLTLALVFVALAAALVVATGRGPTEAVPEEIKAHKFILVDTDGRVRAGLVVVKDGPASTSWMRMAWGGSGWQ